MRCRFHRHLRTLLLLGCLISQSDTVFADKVVFVSDDAFFTVWVLDATTGEALRGFSVPDNAAGNIVPTGRSGLAYDGGELYYTHSSSRQIWVLDPLDGTVQRVLTKPGSINSSALGAGAGSVYVIHPDGREAELYEIDASTGAILDQDHIAAGREALTLASTRGTVFVDTGAFEVQEINATDGSPAASWVPPANLVGLAFEPNSNELFGIDASAKLYQLDPDSGSVLNCFDATDTRQQRVARPGGLAAGELAIPPDTSPPPPDIGNLSGIDGGPPRITFRVRDTRIFSNRVEPVGVELSTNIEIQAFTLAVAHDPAVLSLQDITFDGTETNLQSAEFTSTDLEPNGGTVGAIFDFNAPFDGHTLDPFDHQLVANYHYGCALDDLQVATTTEVRFVENVLGSPSKENVAVVDGLSLTPDVESGFITCTPNPGTTDQPEFYCGARAFSQPLEGRTGAPIDFCVHYAFSDFLSEGIEGLQMAMAFDCRLNCLPDTLRIPPNSVADILGIDFIQLSCDNDPDDGDGCEMVFALLVDVSPPFTGDTLPPVANPTVIACWDMEITAEGEEGEEGECLDVRFRDGVNGGGAIPIKNLTSIKSNDIPPLTFPCDVCVTDSGPSIFCGNHDLESNLRPQTPTGLPGQIIDVCLWYRSPGEPVYGITQAMRHGCLLQCIPGSFRVGPELEGILDFSNVTVICNPGNAGMEGVNCELVVTIDQGNPGDPGVIPLPATGNAPVRLGCVAFRILEETVRGSCIPVVFFDGVQGFDNEVVLEDGPVSPDSFDCEVCAQPGLPPELFCGGPEIDPATGLPVENDRNPAGATVPLCFWYTSPIDDFTEFDSVEGFSIAVEFDCRLKCLEETFRLPLDSITAMVRVEFISFECENDPDDGDGCEMILAMLVDAEIPIEGRTLPPTNDPLLLTCVDMEIADNVPMGECLLVEFKDGIDGNGGIPIKNLFSGKSTARTPITHDCEICTKQLGPKFWCGGEKLGMMGTPAPAIGRPGEAARTCLWYSNPTECGVHHLEGFSMSLKFDCELMCDEDSFSLSPDSILDAMDADFVEFQCDNDPFDGDGCEIIFAVLLDTLPPFDGIALPPTEDPLKVACFDFTMPADAECGDCYNLMFMDGADGTSSLPTKNLVVHEFQSFIALTNDCMVCIGDIQDQIPFIRGDCNDDKEVNIADAAEVIGFLFLTGTWRANPPCLDACDSNDDARVSLADADFLLRWLFKQGPIPPAPGPMMPGVDPTRDKNDCEIGRCPVPQD
jgi:hypothetical protein